MPDVTASYGIEEADITTSNGRFSGLIGSLEIFMLYTLFFHLPLGIFLLKVLKSHKT